MAYYIKGVEITNFRAFDSLTMDGFRRFNLLGGVNGVGKSVLLETLFFSLDAWNEAAPAKPFGWRDVKYPGNDPRNLIRNSEKPATLKVSQKGGPLSIRLKKSNVPTSGRAYLNQATQLEKSNAPEDEGVHVFAKKGKVESETFLFGGKDSLESMIIQSKGNFEFPIAIMVPISTSEYLARFSKVKREGKEASLLNCMKLIFPELSELFIHVAKFGQDDAVLSSQIYARINGEARPINLLGDGFKNLFWTVVSLMNVDGGVLLLDEFDASLHHSIIQKVWKYISEIASSQDCQIFATCHSREAILSSSAGISQSGFEDEFAYFRIERNSFEHSAIHYSFEDMKSADEFNFDFR